MFSSQMGGEAVWAPATVTANRLGASGCSFSRGKAKEASRKGIFDDIYMELENLRQ